MNGARPRQLQILRSIASASRRPRGRLMILVKSRFLDDQFDYYEERIQSLCIDRGVVLFVVSSAIYDDVCRIISARKATRHEQQQYFQGGPLQQQ